jgi:hypothetical protein
MPHLPESGGRAPRRMRSIPKSRSRTVRPVSDPPGPSWRGARQAGGRHRCRAGRGAAFGGFVGAVVATLRLDIDACRSRRPDTALAAVQPGHRHGTGGAKSTGRRGPAAPGTGRPCRPSVRGCSDQPPIASPDQADSPHTGTACPAVARTARERIGHNTPGAHQLPGCSSISPGRTASFRIDALGEATRSSWRRPGAPVWERGTNWGDRFGRAA